MSAIDFENGVDINALTAEFQSCLNRWSDLSQLQLESLLREKFKSTVEALLSRVHALEAARMAYASEFAPNADGLPDVDSIHQNIRALKEALQPGHFVSDVNAVRLRRALSNQGLAAPESLEELAMHLGQHVNRLTISLTEDEAPSQNALTSEEGMMAYRLLGQGEVIRADDEFLLDDTVTWDRISACRTGRGFIGKAYETCGILQPMRRRLDSTIYPMNVYAWGGLSRFHDYEMSDGSVQTLKDAEAHEMRNGKHGEYVIIPREPSEEMLWALYGRFVGRLSNEAELFKKMLDVVANEKTPASP